MVDERATDFREELVLSEEGGCVEVHADGTLVLHLLEELKKRPLIRVTACPIRQWIA